MNSLPVLKFFRFFLVLVILHLGPCNFHKCDKKKTPHSSGTKICKFFYGDDVVHCWNSRGAMMRKKSFESGQKEIIDKLDEEKCDSNPDKKKCWQIQSKPIFLQSRTVNLLKVVYRINVGHGELKRRKKCNFLGDNLANEQVLLLDWLKFWLLARKAYLNWGQDFIIAWAPQIFFAKWRFVWRIA